jgi:hypothetical protein
MEKLQSAHMLLYVFALFALSSLLRQRLHLYWCFHHDNLHIEDTPICCDQSLPEMSQVMVMVLGWVSVMALGLELAQVSEWVSLVTSSHLLPSLFLECLNHLRKLLMLLQPKLKLKLIS